MKIFKKILSAFLAVSMLMSMTCIVSAGAAELPQKLVELDITDYVKETGGETSGKKSGIVNIGTSQTADFVWVSHEQGYQITTKETTEYESGTLDYLDFKMGGAAYMLYQDRASRRKIFDKNFATSANTISFWADAEGDTDHGLYRAVFAYAEDWGDTATNPSLILYQSPNTDQWNITNGSSGAFDVSGYGEWKHVAVVNPEYDANGKKTVEVYINGNKVAERELTIPSGKTESNLNNDRTGFYFGGRPVCLSASSASMPSHSMYADIEVYDGILTQDQIMGIYGSNRGRFGIATPNSVVSEPAVISPDAESFEVEMEKDVDLSEIPELKIITEDGAEIDVDYTASGSVITVKPKGYLGYGKEYVLDFPSLYSGDYTFTTKDSGVALKSYSSVTENKISFTLDTERQEGSITVIAVGFDSNSELCGATSVTVDLASDKEGTLSELGMNTWNIIKLMVWENGDGYTSPLVDVIEVN